jgi:hypothetical protein
MKTALKNPSANCLRKFKGLQLTFQVVSYGLDGPRGETRGAYYLRPCTQELYEAVYAGGRSIPYTVNDEGYLAMLDPREA